MSRRLFHYLCIALLLVAQQGALAHAVWHVGERLGHVAAHEPHGLHDSHVERGDKKGDDNQASLCAFDLAFGQMLGGAHGTNAAVITAELPEACATYHFVPRSGSDAVPEVSRGPPALL